MNNRIFTLVLVVALGVAAGVLIVGKQSQSQALMEVLTQQAQILEGQNRLESKVISEKSTNDGQLAAKVILLEQRVAKLEGDWTTLQNALKQGPQAADARPQENMDTVYEIPVGNSYVRGNKNAKVVIVEFLDYQCPFCARFHAPILEVMKAYPNDVQYIVKNFPLSFHPQARPAAKAALAAGEQGKYYEMSDVLLENSKSLSEDKFQEFAKQIGLDVKQFMKDYTEKDAEYEKIIVEDMQLGGKVNVRGTPTFYLNGKKTQARDLNSFKTEIDAILTK